MATVFKDQAHQLIDSLPETAGWEDLAQRARYLAAVERGIEAAECGDFATPERIRTMFAKWGVEREMGTDLFSASSTECFWVASSG
jgi:predicted transcriptional regulator